jgi:RNA polymerase subunit RPABC4/transcription elongation factor Spt4
MFGAAIGRHAVASKCHGCGRLVREDADDCPTCGSQGITPLDDYSAWGADTKYCCGAIYEEGEDTCASCGEPL